MQQSTTKEDEDRDDWGQENREFEGWMTQLPANSSDDQEDRGSVNQKERQNQETSDRKRSTRFTYHLDELHDGHSGASQGMSSFLRSSTTSKIDDARGAEGILCLVFYGSRASLEIRLRCKKMNILPFFHTIFLLDAMCGPSSKTQKLAVA